METCRHFICWKFGNNKIVLRIDGEICSRDIGEKRFDQRCVGWFFVLILVDVPRKSNRKKWQKGVGTVTISAPPRESEQRRGQSPPRTTNSDLLSMKKKMSANTRCWLSRGGFPFHLLGPPKHIPLAVPDYASNSVLRQIAIGDFLRSGGCLSPRDWTNTIFLQRGCTHAKWNGVWFLGRQKPDGWWVAVLSTAARQQTGSGEQATHHERQKLSSSIK